MTALALLTLLAAPEPPPVHLWYEPEWFPGVEGSFNYWTGTQKPTGKWGVAGPGISAEWSQGGESGWNSIGAAADEERAECGREIVIPRAGKYRVWARYVEHRRKKSPFTVQVGTASQALGEKPVLPTDDEYLLYWGLSFAWGSFDVDLKEGPIPLKLIINRKGEAWRQVDALLLTTDLKHVPQGREKPAFPASRVRVTGALPGPAWPPFPDRPALGGKRFSLWTGVEADPKWWEKQDVSKLRLIDVLHAHSPPKDIAAAFHKQYPRPEDAPLIGSPLLAPGFYLGQSPDLSPGTALRRWLERTKQPFYIMTNYATGGYNEKTGPATYAALTGPLKGQFLGYIHGETVGTVGVAVPSKQVGKDRASQSAAIMRHLKEDQAKKWSAIYKTKVDEAHWARGIPCLSVDSTTYAHLFYEMGSEVIGFEVDATMPNIPMRMAFIRGAARQYGKGWINYASGNFGDACNYFSQEPQVPRGAKSWFHSKYAVTDGVTAGWYRALYFLNYTGGASAIYWEQNMTNQWILPGPGTHPVQLSPFGRGTEDFMAFVEKGPPPGEPVTPVALLLSHAHGWEPTSYTCKHLHHFHETAADRELRELFNVCYHPVAEREGLPASPYTQSMPPAVNGNVFDVLVDRPGRIKAIHAYPVVHAAGSVELGPIAEELRKYVEAGGTLSLTSLQARALPESLLGFKLTGKRHRAEAWRGLKAGGATTPFEVADVQLTGAKAVMTADDRPLATLNKVGKGNVFVLLVPGGMGLDERAHPALAELIGYLALRSSPVKLDVKSGAVWHQIGRTRDALVVTLGSPDGVDKTQNGVARVDRRAVAEVLLTARNVDKAEAWEDGKLVPLRVGKGDDELCSVTVKLGPGSLRVIKLTLKVAK
jgi:hypothetical protein